MSDDYGIQISKDDVDLKDATKKDFVLTSKYENLKVIPGLSGIVTVNVPTDNGDTTATYTIIHNLGYVPICVAGIYIPSGQLGGGYFDGAINMIPFFRYIHSGAGVNNGNVGTFTEISDTQITMQFDEYDYVDPPPHPEVGGYDVRFCYMIFANKLE